MRALWTGANGYPAAGSLPRAAMPLHTSASTYHDSSPPYPLARVTPLLLTFSHFHREKMMIFSKSFLTYFLVIVKSCLTYFMVLFKSFSPPTSLGGPGLTEARSNYDQTPAGRAWAGLGGPEINRNLKHFGRVLSLLGLAGLGGYGLL